MTDRVLICGSRDWTDPFVIQTVLNAFPSGTVIIHGAGRGADSIAAEIASAMGFDVLPFPAKWAKYGPKAGPIRNQQMLDEGKPTEVHAFSNNLVKGSGTFDMVERARKAGLPVAVYGSHHFTHEDLNPLGRDKE